MGAKTPEIKFENEIYAGGEIPPAREKEKEYAANDS
jgi:hypothetical protein